MGKDLVDIPYLARSASYAAVDQASSMCASEQQVAHSSSPSFPLRSHGSVGLLRQAKEDATARVANEVRFLVLHLQSVILPYSVTTLDVYLSVQRAGYCKRIGL